MKAFAIFFFVFLMFGETLFDKFWLLKLIIENC